jgi:threonine/homoserine/homoserine lactone efflux protein
LEPLWSFLMTAFALVGSPGPNTLSAAAVGASFGKRRGLAYVAGLNLGVGLVIVIVGTGISGAVLAVPGIAPVITTLAALYFLYLAWRIATAPPLSEAGATLTQAPPWYAGVLLSLSNPKAYAAMGALFSGHRLLPEVPLMDGLWKATLAIGCVCAVNLCWLYAGAALAGYLRTPRATRITNILFAALLIVSVILVALQ